MSNLFTPTRRVIKLDYWGQPYEATVTGRKELDLATLWQLWRTRTAEAEAHAAKHRLYERGHGSLPVSKINTHFEMQEEPQL